MDASTCCDYKCGSCLGAITSCTTCSDPTRSNPPACGCNPGFYDDLSSNPVC